MLHVTVHPRRFADRLKAVAGFAAKQSTFRPLGTVLFDVHEDGSATLRAKSFEAEVQSSVSLASLVEPGAVLLLSDPVLKALGNAKGGLVRIEETAPERVPITSDPNVPTRRVVVATSRLEIGFPTYRPEDFPELLEHDPGRFVELPAWQLDRLIERTQFATDPDSTRYALGGCALEFEEPDPPGSAIGRLSLVATDGRRLAHAYAPASGTGLDPPTQLADNPEQSLAPAVSGALLNRLRPLLATPEQPNRVVRLGWTEAGRLQVTAGGLHFSARQLTGRFPPWRDVIPPPSPHRTRIADGTRLKRALKEAKGLLPKGHRCVRFRLVRNVLFIEVNVEDISSSSQVLTLRRDMPQEPEAVEIGFDPDYLLDWLAVMSNFELILPSSPKQPAVMKAEGVDYYVMPIEGTEPEAGTPRPESVAEEDDSEEDREAKTA